MLANPVERKPEAVDNPAFHIQKAALPAQAVTSEGTKPGPPLWLPR
jgi:hypothetical protein